MAEVKKKFNIHEYTHILGRRKWFFIVPLVIICVSFFVTSYFLPRVYEAKAIILIEEKKVVNPLLKNIAVSTTVAERLASLREEILAWPRLYQLVERLGLNKNAASPLDLERLIFKIRKNIILTLKAGDIVEIAYQGDDPQATQKLVNTLCDILIERNLSLQSEDTESAINFINEQLVIYKNKLDTSETALRKFKEVYGVSVLPQLMRPQQAESSATIAPDPKRDEAGGVAAPLVQVSQELAQLEADLVLASVDCTDEHPRIKDLKRRINSLREKRDQYVKEAAKKTGVDPQAYVDIAGSLPRQEEELTRLSRDKAINERLYSMFLERLESAKVTERLDSSENRTKFRIIEPARLPLFPAKPNKAKVTFLGFLLGGMFGFGSTCLAEYVDSSFKGADELKDVFELPVFGTITRIVTEEDVERKKKFTRKLSLVTTYITIFITLLTILIIKLNFSS